MAYPITFYALTIFMRSAQRKLANLKTALRPLVILSVFTERLTVDGNYTGLS
jgi:hypothetical protein